MYVPSFTELRKNARGKNEMVRHKAKIADLLPSGPQTIEVQGTIRHEHHVYHHGNGNDGGDGAGRSRGLPPTSYRGAPGGDGAGMLSRGRSSSRSSGTTRGAVDGRSSSQPFGSRAALEAPPESDTQQSQELELRSRFGLNGSRAPVPGHAPSRGPSRGMGVVEYGQAVPTDARGMPQLPGSRRRSSSRAMAMNPQDPFGVGGAGIPPRSGSRPPSSRPPSRRWQETNVPVGQPPSTSRMSNATSRSGSRPPSSHQLSRRWQEVDVPVGQPPSTSRMSNATSRSSQGVPSGTRRSSCRSVAGSRPFYPQGAYDHVLANDRLAMHGFVRR